MAEMLELQRRFGWREDAPLAIAAYRPRPTDIVISPFGKCGTTWLQQTFHCLRTRGDMDFDDISRVVPWIETSRTLGIDLEAAQRAQPRGFKSHMSWREIPKGARYVVSLRDPKDALVSMYRFMEGWYLEPGAIPIADFAEPWIGRADGMDYWSHLLSWWEQRDNPEVLLLAYEHMIRDPADHVARLAAFCGIELDEALAALTLERSSFAYMSAHKDRFDDKMMRQATEARCGLPAGSDSAKVRAGGVGGHKAVLPAETLAALDAKWESTIEPALGVADYESLLAELATGRNRRA
ncbi:MAG TPA: sulfotransferase domain-containing protein [Caulobacteraceae bacterium]|jgi:hypothetical protein